MAFRSPIVVDSSSQASSRPPSVTPQRDRRKSSVLLSSSPGLAELPTFAEVPAKGLKLGSNAQQAPQGASLGYASAATVFKNVRAEAQPKERGQDDATKEVIEDGGKPDAAPMKGSGKFPKPKKTDKSGTGTKSKSRDLKRNLLREASDDQEDSKVLDTGNSCPYFGQIKSRTPSVSHSEFDFRPEEHERLPPRTTAPSKPDKKSRQRKPKVEQPAKKDVLKKVRPRSANTSSKNAAGTKPKRQFTKSATIILNSDDSDVDTRAIVERPRKEAGSESSKVVVNQAYNGAEDNFPRIPFQVEKAVNWNSIAATAVDQSAYFSKHPERAEVGSQASMPGKEARPESPQDEASNSLPTLMAAPRRRLSWTPAKNTVKSTTVPDGRPGTASSTGSEGRPKSLASFISGFEYTESMGNALAQERTLTGEALTKRQRIELADATTIAPAKRKATHAVPSEPKKKIKKKPQTITALAVKDYHHEPDVVPAQPSVSEFFDPDPHGRASTNVSGAQLDELEKPAKPRKSRAKRPDDEATASNTKKSRKPRKTKVKFNEKDIMAKLCTPDEARAQEQSQDFMFGTSSQLVLEESPSFICDMQAAIHESEMIPASQTQHDSGRMGHAPVLNSSRGVRLSISQAASDFWHSAARDQDGRVLEVDTDWERPRTAAHVSSASASTSLASLEAIITGNDYAANVYTSTISDQRQHDPSNPTELNGQHPDCELQANLPNAVIDLCQTSPVDHDSRVERSNDVKDSVGTRVGGTLTAALLPPQCRTRDDWTILSSNDSVQRPVYEAQTTASTLPRPPSPAQPLKPPQLIRSATSPLIHRTALQSLDANAGLLSQKSPLKSIDIPQSRSLMSTAPDQARPPRGRPRKTASAVPAAASSPKRRGRPPKAAKIGTDTSVPSSECANSATQPAMSASQPTKPSSWADIDEISDSDSLFTPSPPRQRAGSSPPRLQPLDLSVARSPSLKARAPAVLSSNLKSTDAHFADIQADLFPKISATIRSTPPSTDMKNPTWHEKILLYDPIVLEDLTAWLNEQGLGIEVQRLKPKPKDKGRKKKDAASDGPECEFVKEDLKPWMVQKWCEEKSICCLWKEGLRGGVRTRY